MAWEPQDIVTLLDDNGHPERLSTVVDADGAIEDIKAALPDYKVVLIGQVKFVVLWRNGALTLVPKSVNDMFYTNGVTKTQAGAMNTDEFKRAYAQMYDRAGLVIGGGFEKYLSSAPESRTNV